MIPGRNPEFPGQACAAVSAGGGPGHGGRAGRAGRAGRSAAAAAPALAAPRPGGPAASHTRAAATGQHAATGRMSSGAPWTQIAAGEFHTCGIRTGGTCGAGATTATASSASAAHRARTCPGRSSTPAPGGLASPPAATTPARPAPTAPCGAGATTATASSASATTPARTVPHAGQTPAPGGWAGVTAGGDHTCATRTGGTLWCWGDNGIRPARHRQPLRPGPAAAGHQLRAASSTASVPIGRVVRRTGDCIPVSDCQ